MQISHLLSKLNLFIILFYIINCMKLFILYFINLFVKINIFCKCQNIFLFNSKVIYNIII